MANAIKIRKGNDIRLKGAAEKALEVPSKGQLFAIKPTDFYHLTPKVIVREGDTVQAGDVLFHDKYNEAIRFNAPVSGTVKAVVRGEKRRVLAVEIAADAQTSFKDFGSYNPTSGSRTDLMKRLFEGGMWPFIVQRPFNVIARPDQKPKAIFISGFDSSPLAPDADFVMEGLADDFKAGIAAMKVLADGKPVHLGHRKGSTAFKALDGLSLHEVKIGRASCRERVLVRV